MLSQLRSSLNRHRALLDDQSISGRTLGNGSRDSLDRRQIGIAIGQGRGSYADENRVSPGDGVFGRAKMQPPRLAHALDHPFQMRLEQRHPSALELGKLLGVAFTAKDVVSDLREASRRRQTHVTRAYD